MKRKLNFCLGIDLGTTNSVVSYLLNEDFKIVENNDGLRITPSVVFIDENNRAEVGIGALRRSKKSPKDVFSSFKRLIGQKFNNLKKLNLPFEIIEGEHGMCDVKDSRGKVFSPIFLSSLLLKQLKEDAERSLKGIIENAVITVPAYFNNDQREATKKAGELAGLNVLRIINEPTSAALVSSDIQEGKLLVFDLGGGTFDVSIIEKIKEADANKDIYHVMTVSGDSQLGGRDFDTILFEKVDEKIKKLTGKSIYSSPKGMIELQEAVEGAKKQLSYKMESDISIPYLDPKVFGFDSNDDPYSIEYNFTRVEYEKLVSNLVDKVIKITKNALKEGEISSSDVNEVILVGGMTRTPIIKSKLIEIFGEGKINQRHNPDEVVSLGASKHGAILTGHSEQKLTLVDTVPLSLGIETLGGVFTEIIEKNTAIPQRNERIFSTAADNQPAVSINIFQGNRSLVKDNHPLGSFDLLGIAPAPRGVPQIKVIFDIDENGILNVSATDEKTGKIQELKIQSNLDENQIKKMTKEAEEFKESDEIQKNFIDKKNILAQTIMHVEKQLDESLSNEDIHIQLLKLITDGKTLLNELSDPSRIKELDSFSEELDNLNQSYLKFKHGKNPESPKQEEETSKNEENSNESEGSDSEKN